MRSLRWQLFAWLLPVAILVVVAGTVADYLIVRSASAESHDRGLLDGARLYADHLREHPEAVGGEPPPEAQRVLPATPDDRVFFALRDAAGRALAGDARLPDDLPLGTLEVPYFFNHQHAGYWLRGVHVGFDVGGQPLQLVLGITDRKRELLMGQILLGIVAPQFVLFLVTMFLVWAAVRRGLVPLAAFQAEIAKRSHSDLRPLDPEGAPEELRPMVRELNGLLLRLDRALETQRHFVADAAHQLRTPVAGLLAQVEAGGIAGEGLPQLERTARRLSRLVGQLLTLSRTEPGVEPAREDFDLAGLVREAAADWLPAAFGRDIDVQFDLRPAWLAGSPQAIRESLANLVDNAVRYGRDGGRIKVSCGGTAAGALLAVEDDGPGIPAAERERVFERFYRLPGNGADGCGLGLAIVRSIARQHGGDIALSESLELGGLRAELRLPRRPPAPVRKPA